MIYQLIVSSEKLMKQNLKLINNFYIAVATLNLTLVSRGKKNKDSDVAELTLGEL